MPELQAAKDPKKPIAITSIKQWIKAAAQKRNINNPGFLKETKFFLSTCELSSEVLPILQAWEKQPITNKAIEAIYRILADHHSAKLLDKAASSAKRNNWTVRIFGSDSHVLNGPVTLREEKTFAMGWDAERYADRRLCEGGSDYFAIIDSHTEKTELRIERRDAIDRVLNARKAQAATVPTVKVSASRLSLGVGGQYNKRVYFSRG